MTAAEIKWRDCPECKALKLAQEEMHRRLDAIDGSLTWANRQLILGLLVLLSGFGASIWTNHTAAEKVAATLVKQNQSIETRLVAHWSDLAREAKALEDRDNVRTP